MALNHIRAHPAKIREMAMRRALLTADSSVQHPRCRQRGEQKTVVCQRREITVLASRAVSRNGTLNVS